MIWTTKYEDGTFRTIDTNNASILDLIIDTILDWIDSKRGEKIELKTGKN